MDYISTVSTESHGLENSTACGSKLSAFRFIDYSIGAMATAEKDEEGKKHKRKDNIITLKPGDSQESLDKVSDFIFKPSLRYSFFISFSFAVSPS